MAPVFKIAGRDISQYIDVSSDELDPVNAERIEPQFAGVQALGEGLEFSGDAVGNRAWTVPLVLARFADRAALHQFVRDLNRDLVKGAQVEFAHDSADPSTFFDLERGRLDMRYQFYLSTHATSRATLRLWTRPYGITGTMRDVVPSQVTTGPAQFMVTGISGDVNALTKLAVGNQPSQAARFGNSFFWGVHRSASFRAVWPAASVSYGAGYGLVGASGAIGSQALEHYLSGGGGNDLAYMELDPGAYFGYHRLFAVVQSRYGPSLTSALYARDIRAGGYATPLTTLQTGATAQPSHVGSNAYWQVLDMGEINVPRAATGASAGPMTVVLTSQRASGVTAFASPAIRTAALILLPLDQGAGMLMASNSVPESGQQAATAAYTCAAYPAFRVSRDQTFDGPQQLIDLSHRSRGELPQLPPIPSGQPSGPMQLVVIEGDRGHLLGNKPFPVQVRALERFNYLR